MTGINLSIEKNGITKPYAILYSELYGMYIAQIIDEKTLKIFEAVEKTKDECIDKITSKLNELGTIKHLAESPRDEYFIDMINKLKE